MKKLSTEQKAKRYDEALGMAKSWYIDAKIDFKKSLETLFPELSEPEDERIMKALIYHYQGDGCICTNEYRIDYKEIRVWLEKQVQKPQGKSAIEASKEEKVDNANKVEPKDYSSIDPHFFKPDDKIEPKFHEGDWVVSPNGVYWHIDKISNNRYEVTSNTGESSNWNLDTNIYHRFTIQDAKDGDVLSYRDGQWIFIYKGIVTEDTFKYYALLSEKGITVNDAAFSLLSSYITPATKEQRDTLEKVMADAGYTFDFGKKELKEIKNSTAWSEEDERYWSIIIAEFSKCAGKSVSKDEWMCCNDWLNSLRDRVQPQPKWSEEDEKYLNTTIAYLKDASEFPENAKSCINWLKSLSPQSHWKPNEEQIEILNMVLTNESMDDNVANILRKLREQLKKLREE